MSNPCSKACVRGNPNRGYVCQCTRCGGKAHGATTISFAYLEEIIDRKLRDPTLSKADYARWLEVMKALLTPRSRLRRVA